MFAAHEKDGGAFIGWFCLRPEPEGPRALLGKAFTELGVRMVWAATMSVNLGSRNIMEKLEMTLADTIPTPSDMLMAEGSDHGGVRYEITKEQWEQRRRR
ncbi:GNAT family N-acetyltransferase [Streptomyces kaniharaensis]|uniref:GNAT family N-acetyltransferase n=1 Tax=Streptomyces kaniharaensis TaxID=212423 RepID=UPI001E29D0F0|nr:GNAT family protein [Streptomyces kaniharaensis]